MSVVAWGQFLGSGTPSWECWSKCNVDWQLSGETHQDSRGIRQERREQSKCVNLTPVSWGPCESPLLREIWLSAASSLCLKSHDISAQNNEADLHGTLRTSITVTMGSQVQRWDILKEFILNNIGTIIIYRHCFLLTKIRGLFASRKKQYLYNLKKKEFISIHHTTQFIENFQFLLLGISVIYRVLCINVHGVQMNPTLQFKEWLYRLSIKADIPLASWIVCPRGYSESVTGMISVVCTTWLLEINGDGGQIWQHTVITWHPAPIQLFIHLRPNDWDFTFCKSLRGGNEQTG